MGIQDLLHLKGLSFKSPKTIKLMDRLYEFISYYTIESSVKLAEKFGSYPKFKGSKWDNGKLPIDTFKDLMEYKQGNVENIETRLDWDLLRRKVVENGIRNSTLMAIAPTVSISSIVGFSPSIEPLYSVLFSNSTLSGEFTVINEYFVNEMKELGLWNQDLVREIKNNNGVVS